MISPDVNVTEDIAAMNRGDAVPGVGPNGAKNYTVNGRVYEIEANGTVYPVDGPGLFPLNRPAFKALGVLNKFGNSDRAAEILASMKIADADIEAAKAAWRSGQ